MTRLSGPEERALAMARSLRRLLEGLSECPKLTEGHRSCIRDAWERMEDVISMIEPPEPETDNVH